MTDILETAEIVPHVAKDIDKPVLCSFMGIVDVSEGIQYLERHGIPNYAFPEAAVRSMAAMFFYGELLSLDKREVRRVAADSDTASAVIKEKLAGKESYYMSKFKPSAKIDGVIIERMAKRGVEVILGAVRDPKFGPMCMFGLGGTFVEAMKDVTFRLAPMWEISAEIMIRTIKAYSILKGVRGAPPYDIDSIKDCLLRLSQMLSEHPEITELDINPLIVYPEGQGCVVADSRILLKNPE